MVKRCTDCNLSAKCYNPLILGRGSHRKRTKYMIIQEAPGKMEEKWDKVLSGDIQAKLSYLLEKSKIPMNEVYFTSAVKCNPGKISQIKQAHLNECQKYLFQEIMDHRPEIIIPMGRWAWQAVSEYKSIREFVGHFDMFSLDYGVELNGKELTRTFEAKVIPTFSLAGSLKKWEYNSSIIKHFVKARKYVVDKKIHTTKQPKVNVILSMKSLKEWEERMKSVTLCATDYETMGFNFWEHGIINSGYCTEIGKADVIYVNPYKKKHTEKWDKLDIKRAIQINKFLKNHRSDIINTMKKVHAYKNVKFILHNGKFDSKFAAVNKMPYKNFYFDTLVASSLIDENLPHALNMCLERNNIDFGAYDTKLWKYTNKDEKKKKSYQYVPPLLLEKYLGMDVDGCFRLYFKQIVSLQKEKMIHHLLHVKMPALRDLTKIEYTGVKANKKLILKASRIVQKKQKKLQEKLVEVTNNKEFNPNSPNQIIQYLIDNEFPMERLQIAKTASGNYSTAQDELSKFLKFKKWKEFPQLVLNSKKLSKIRGTYIDGKNGLGGMLQYLDQKNRIHANFNMWSPRTGRYSCNRPSLQVWPRPIKGLPNTRNFIRPTNDNWSLFEADYSQLEQCIVAALSKDKVLVKRIQGGIDLHCINASDLGKLLGSIPQWVSYEHMLVTNDKAHKISDKKLVKELLRQVELDGKDIDWHEKRTQAKGIGFGLNYGKGAQSFSEDFGISIDESQEMIDAYFDIYSGMFDWREGIVNQALNKGYIELMSGRKRRFHAGSDWINSEWAERCWSAKTLKEEISRQAMNFPVQGGAHEVFEPACRRLMIRFKKEHLKARLLLSIHDGIVGECPKDERQIVEKCIKEEMPFTFNKSTKYEINLNIDIDHYKYEWYGEKIKLNS